MILGHFEATREAASKPTWLKPPVGKCAMLLDLAGQL